MTSMFSRVVQRLFPDFFRPVTPYGLLAPKHPHRRLLPHQVQGKRIFIVGDVHGCYDELLSLLEEADALLPTVQVVFVGDLLNKGPKNIACVELARKIGALCVRGNHDEVALSVLHKARRSGKPLPVHMAWLADLSPESEQWLLDLPYTIYFGERNALFVHAGLVPGVPLIQQLPEDMIHMRNVIRDETAGAYAGIRRASAGEAWATVWPGPVHVYFGHDARRKLQRERFATGLDTGCVYGGALSGVYLDDEAQTIYSVSPKEVYRQP